MPDAWMIYEAIRHFCKRYGHRHLGKLERMDKTNETLASLLTQAIVKDHWSNGGQGSARIAHLLDNPDDVEAYADVMYALNRKATMAAIRKIRKERR